MAVHKVDHVVVDSGAFIKNAPIKDIAENVYTIQDVIAEIRDSATKKRLAVLPYEIRYRDPLPEHVHTVSEFAKKTGDYRSLSAVDIRLMALTYQLTKQHVGTEHLKRVPDKQATWSSSMKPLEQPTHIAGWYLPPKTTASKQSTKSQDADESVNSQLENVNIDDERKSQEDNKEIQVQPDSVNEVHSENVNQVSEEMIDDKHNDSKNRDIVDEISEQRTHNEDQKDCSKDSRVECKNEEDIIVEVTEADEEKHVAVDGGKHVQFDGLDNDSNDDMEDGSEEESDDDDDDDGGGWITPKNIHKVKAELHNNHQPLENITVGCMTADFAMQNVLIQMGIPVLSVSGMLIKRAKSYVLKCHACFKVTKIMTKQFCPSCGNQTLRKIAVTVNDDGTQHYHISRRREDTTRGLKYTLPMPKGGKHSDNPILVEDQPLPQNRTSRKSRQTTNAFDPDYVANISPFAMRDVTSRAAQLGVGRINSGHCKNPNENRRKKRR